MARPLTVMLVAAEASGDDRGAALARALKLRLEGALRLVGVGGAAMAAEGVDSPFDIRELSVLGLWEGLMAWPRVRRRVRETAALAARERPDIVVLIDSWGFTLRVARRLRKMDAATPLVKYVGPQVWASRPGRARTLAGAVDHLLTIHRFDVALFEAAGLPTTFVGNTALRLDFAGADPERLRRRLGVDLEQPLLLVLPGSRPAEIARLMGPFGQAVERLQSARPDLAVAVLAATSVTEAVKSAAAAWPRPPILIEGEADKLSAMRAATVGLACSGTVTSELALAGCPMVVAYKVSPITYLLLKLLIRTRFITLFNIAAQAFVAPEFVQAACSPAALAEALAARLDDAELRRRQSAAQSAALELMGRDGMDPSMAAAEVVLALAGRAPGQTRTL